MIEDTMLLVNTVDDELIKELKEMNIYDYLLKLKKFVSERYYPHEVVGTDLQEKYLIDVIVEYFIYFKFGIRNNFSFWHEHKDKTYKQLKEYYFK